MKWWKLAQARNQQFRRAEQKTEELNATMERSAARERPKKSPARSPLVANSVSTAPE